VTRKLIYLLIVLLLAACSQNPPPAVIAPPVTQVTEAEATATSVPPDTPTAAIESTLPPVVVVTAAATNTPEATPTAEPTATPEPVTLLTKEDFGTDRNPFTGELVADPAVLQRRPIAVKISNNPPEYTRPQAGLTQADLVFEHVTEGPITRFTAIFYSQTPPDIGPIRSARLIDIEIPAMYDAALSFSGANVGVSQLLFRSDIRPRILRSNETGYYRTGEDKPWEHTLHGDPTGFWEALDARGENHAPNLTAFMAFSSVPPEGGEAAGHIDVQYGNFGTMNWEYDADNGRYWRSIDGVPHVDRNTDEQISAANVAVVFALHQQHRSICIYPDASGGCASYATESQIWGQGDAIIFRDGRQYDAIWKRVNRSDMLTFYDSEDNVIPLQVGNTWFEVMPYHYTDPVTVTP
jgi:hypothetical protein